MSDYEFLSGPLDLERLSPEQLNVLSDYANRLVEFVWGPDSEASIHGTTVHKLPVSLLPGGEQ